MMLMHTLIGRVSDCRQKRNGSSQREASMVGGTRGVMNGEPIPLIQAIRVLTNLS